MPVYLVVANQTLGGQALLDAIEERSRPDASFHVVVPATPSHDLRATSRSLTPLAKWSGESSEPSSAPTGTDAAGVERATERLDLELERLRAIGVEATGEVGAADPVRAVEHVTSERHIDEILLSTLPAGLSRWLRTDLPRKLAKVTSIPVVHIESPPPDAVRITDDLAALVSEADWSGSVTRERPTSFITISAAGHPYRVVVAALDEPG